MSRQRDLLHLNQQLQGLGKRRDELVAEYEVSRKDYEGRVNAILTKAKVKDAVDALNAELEQIRQASQNSVNAVGTQITEVQKIGQYLLGRDKADPDTPHMVEGIDINLLGHETRAMVLAGNRETIDALKASLAAREAEAAAAEAADEAPDGELTAKKAPAKKAPAKK